MNISFYYENKMSSLEFQQVLQNSGKLEIVNNNLINLNQFYLGWYRIETSQSGGQLKIYLSL